MKALTTILFLLVQGISLFPLILMAQSENGTPAANSVSLPGNLPANLLQISETDSFSKYVLLVDKDQRKLFVYERQGSTIKLTEEFDADIGKNDGNKTKRDDHKTPEGIYFLESNIKAPKIPFETYGLQAFTTNYPNFFDTLEKKTGDGIWLHAIPDTVPLTRGSRGCVVVRNNVIEKLEKYIKLKETPIVIFDNVDYVSAEEHTKRTQEYRDWLTTWASAWEKKDLDKYLSFYDERFKAPGFDYKSWVAHKTNLKNKYDFIKVDLSQPFLLLHRNQLIIKTLQKYTSNQHTDYGVKTLYVTIDKNKNHKIVREEWVPSKENGQVLGQARLEQKSEPHN
jgi:murein L,D-transpeptidase YafK